MDSKGQQPKETANMDSAESLDRRDLVQKLGRFAAYAAPFTVLAATASAANGAGSGKKPASPKS
jgi:hypothetical protein